MRPLFPGKQFKCTQQKYYIVNGNKRKGCRSPDSLLLDYIKNRGYQGIPLGQPNVNDTNAVQTDVYLLVALLLQLHLLDLSGISVSPKA